MPLVATRTGRYDKPRLLGQRLLAIFLSLAFLAMMAAIIVTLTTRAFNGDPKASVTGFTVVSDREVTVRFSVRKRAGSRAFCIVRARGLDGSEVGRDVAEVDPEGNSDKELRTAFSLATTGRAVTGEVAGCSSSAISKVVDPDHH
jgi:uncharacterized protein (DUF58 family)